MHLLDAIEGRGGHQVDRVDEDLGVS
jgi:hypothetical protein